MFVLFFHLNELISPRKKEKTGERTLNFSRYLFIILLLEQSNFVISKKFSPTRAVVKICKKFALNFD